MELLIAPFLVMFCILAIISPNSSILEKIILFILLVACVFITKVFFIDLLEINKVITNIKYKIINKKLEKKWKNYNKKY